MVAVASSEDGTAVEIFKDFPFDVAAKAGTAETGHGDAQSSNALFVCYAPADDQKLQSLLLLKNLWYFTAPVTEMS